MKIVFVIPYFYPALQYGGQPRSAFELARGLVQRGHHVKVLTTDSGGDSRLSPRITGKDNSQVVDGIQIRYYRNISNALAFRQRLFWPGRLFRELPAQLAGFDVMHIHELRSFLTVAAAGASQRAAMPYVLSPHGGLRHLGKHGIKSLFDQMWGNRILKRAAAVIAVSPLEEKDAVEFKVDPSRIRQIPNAIDLSDYQMLPARGIFRERYGIGDRKLVLFLGRLHWIKGADLLVRAFSMLAQLPFEAHLVLAGPDDGQAAELKSLVDSLKLNDRVTFTGFLDDQHKNQALTACDVLAVPSRSEIFAIAAVEALACARPVVLSSACGLSPMPGPQQGVRVFSSGDDRALLAAMNEVLSDRKFSNAAVQGREFVGRHFSISAVAERAESVYKEISGASREGN